MKTFPRIVGKALKVKIPLLFDEVYVAEAKGTSTRTEFSPCSLSPTEFSGSLENWSRSIETHEKPEHQSIVRAKAGLDASDNSSFQNETNLTTINKGEQLCQYSTMTSQIHRTLRPVLQASTMFTS
jgi:hypothetical protein